MKKENYINLSVVEEDYLTRLILDTTTYVKDIGPLLNLFIEANKFKHLLLDVAHEGYERHTGYQVKVTATLSIPLVSNLHQTVRELIEFIDDLEPDVKVYTNPMFDETKEQSEVPNNYHREG